MKKKFLLLIMLMCVMGGVNLSQVNAQDNQDPNVVTIGITETINSDYKFPLSTYNSNSFSQSYYLSNEINKPIESIIKKIAVKIDNITYDNGSEANPESLVRNISVYLTNTSYSEFLSTNKKSVAINTATDIVFNGEIDITDRDANTGWLKIELQNNFTYNGENILVTIYDHTGGYTDYQTFFNNFETGFVDNVGHYRTLYKTNSVNPAESTTLSNTMYTPCIQFTFADNSEDVTPAIPTFITDGNWNNPENWEGKVIPEDNENVIIKAAATIPSGSVITPGNITFEEGGSLTIADGGQLITNQEDLEVTVQKEITAYTNDKDGWYTISSPVANYSLGTDILDGDYDLYRYNESSYLWENQEQENFTTLETGRGYLYANSTDKTLEFTGNINISDITYNLSMQGDELTGFNLIGNPFTHDIYMSQTMINASTLTLEITMEDSYNNEGDGWNDNYLNVLCGSTLHKLEMTKGGSLTYEIEVEPSTEVYISYVNAGRYPEENSFKVKYQGDNDYLFEWSYKNNPTTKEEEVVYYFETKSNNTQSIVDGFYTLSNDGAWNTVLSSNTAIKPCQGILVKALQEGPLTIKKDATVPASKRSATPSIAINVSNEKYNDVAYVTFNGGIGLDKIAHRNENIPMVYIPVDNINYAIAVMNEDVEEIPFSFEAKTMGKYTISVKADNFKSKELTLIDRMTDESINMLTDNYSFMATTTDTPNRFVLKLANSQQPTANGNFAYVSGEDLILSVEGSVQIIDMMGRVVYSNNVESTNNRVNVSDFNNGAYIVRVINENGVKVQKIIL